jgi:hypothetical protein
MTTPWSALAGLGQGWSRRELLQLPLAAVLAASARASAGQAPLVLPQLPRVNGGMNIQPIRYLNPTGIEAQPVVGPDLVELQIRFLYELGFQSLRITLAFENFSRNFLAAVPYVRAARALGIDVVGIMVDFDGFDLLRALVVPRVRREVVATYLDVFAQPVAPASPGVPRPGRFMLQVLNEPTHFFGIPPRNYVGDFLAPVHADVGLLWPSIPVVSAAPVGNVDGVLRLREMLAAGLESVCEYVAVHVYSERLIDMMSGLARRRPVLVTESGVAGPDKHLDWVTGTFPRIAAGIRGTEQVFFFELLDLDPNRWRVIDVRVEPSGAYTVRAESPLLLDHWRRLVVAATEGLPHASFSELIPDIADYYPTDQDRERMEDGQRRAYG